MEDWTEPSHQLQVPENCTSVSACVTAWVVNGKILILCE